MDGARFWGFALAVTWCGLGCGGPGRYGYARQYAFADGEEAHARRADADAIYDEVRRFPHQYAGREFGWFGVVTAVERADDGGARAVLELRTHQPRHLCADETEGSCRVTVSAQSPGTFTALLQLRPEDRAGEYRVQPLSLLRVYGPLAPGADATGAPVIRAEYYRHWPRGQYVTTTAADALRR